MVMLTSPAPYGWIGLPFGATLTPYSAGNPHRGQDHGWLIKDAQGSRRVVSPAPGIVRSVQVGYKTGRWENGGWGNRVEIDITDRAYVALNHLDTVYVRQGQRVARNTSVGFMGATGYTDGGVHLHEEVYIDGVRVDPAIYRTRDLPGTPVIAGATLAGSEDDMTPDQAQDLRSALAAAQAAEAAAKATELRVAEIHVDVGVIRQVLMETEQWSGIDQRLSKALAELDTLTAQTKPKKQ